MVKVLFVCMGNICRSPMAEGAFRAAAEKAGLLDKMTIDSAGTTRYHAGEAPDRRAQETAKKRGVDISYQRARQVTQEDFETFDYILAMDRDNYDTLMERSPDAHKHKIGLFLTHAPELPLDEMPDPYYGHRDQFDSCYAAAMDAAEGLLAKIRDTHF
ncbi:low molecular weight protein-tyrosine-phosphatase [Kordiimonas marina]|uniref:low molecular weight protein-tyrosine-phosphatase n=1 Tax=Kordiimonas marina TaxID=2872312 RepID=UPI001FF31DB8